MVENMMRRRDLHHDWSLVKTACARYDTGHCIGCLS